MVIFLVTFIITQRLVKRKQNRRKNIPSFPPEREVLTQGRTNGPIERGWVYIDGRGAPGAEGAGGEGHTFHQWLAYGLTPLLPRPSTPKELVFFFPRPA